VLKDLIKYIKAGLNVALVGPAGSGKSYLTRQAAKALGKDYYVNGSAMSKYDLIGYNDANGNYHGTPAYDAFTKGGVHTFDEFDASAPDAAVAFNGMTDDQPFYTYKQDAAAMNRFVRIYVDYNESVEWAIADKDIVERAHAVRRACQALGIRHVVSTRTIKHMQKARTGGVSNRAIDRDILFAGLNADTIKQIKGQV
jgi:MoxR-like ATPase